MQKVSTYIIKIILSLVSIFAPNNNTGNHKKCHILNPNFQLLSSSYLCMCHCFIIIRMMMWNTVCSNATCTVHCRISWFKLQPCMDSTEPLTYLQWSEPCNHVLVVMPTLHVFDRVLYTMK